MFIICGATGNTGAAAAEALLAAGKQVRVVVRDPKKGEPWLAKGAQIAVADFSDSAALAQAFRGAEGVYLLLPPFAPNETGLSASRKALTDSIVAAVREARPGHVVLLSSFGAQHASGTGPIAWLYALEKGLEATGVPATFLRAGFFMENWGMGLKTALGTSSLYQGLEKEKKIPMVHNSDIGKTAARLLLEPVAAGTRIVELAGPEDYSFADAAATLARLTGKPIQAVQLPIEQLIGALAGMGMSPEVAALMGEMTGAINSGRVGLEGGRAVFARGETTLEQALGRMLQG